MTATTQASEGRTEGDHMNNTWDQYPFRSGTITEHGTIEAVSLTAYLIDGTWVPFHLVHGNRPAVEPLVVIR